MPLTSELVCLLTVGNCDVSLTGKMVCLLIGDCVVSSTGKGINGQRAVKTGSWLGLARQEMKAV